MKLLRRILRYLFLLAFIVVLGLAYYYRSVIFSEQINTSVDNTIHGVLVMANIVPEQTESATPEIQAKPDCEKPKDVAVKKEAEPVTSELEITEPQAVVESDVDQGATEEPEQADALAMTEEVERETTSTEEQASGSEVEFGGSLKEPLPPVAEEDTAEALDTIPVPVQEQPDTETTREDLAPGELENDGSRPRAELINQARLLHLTGNTNNAIDLYRELGELYPDDPNVVGELGNIFYTKGEWKQASQAYYEAALRLHKLRQNEQIHYLYLVIHGLDPETAEKLRERLES